MIFILHIPNVKGNSYGYFLSFFRKTLPNIFCYLFFFNGIVTIKVGKFFQSNDTKESMIYTIPVLIKHSVYVPLWEWLITALSNRIER